MISINFIEALRAALDWTNDYSVVIRDKYLAKQWDDGEQLNECRLFFLDEISKVVIDRELCALIIYFDVDGVYTIHRQGVF